MLILIAFQVMSVLGYLILAERDKKVLQRSKWSDFVVVCFLVLRDVNRETS